MANAFYGLGLQGFLDGTIDWDTDDIKVLLVDTDDYTVNLTTDNDYNDVTGAGIVATSSNLGSKTVALGVADAADITFTAVTGDVSEALVIYQDTGNPATSRLICYIDTATGLPVTPNSGDITVAWPAGGIFTL